METHELKLIDAQAKKEFEKLLGFKIHGDSVRVTHETYLKYAGAIHGIQMGVAFRLKR